LIQLRALFDWWKHVVNVADVNATAGVAAGRDIRNVTINIGLNAEEIEELIQDAITLIDQNKLDNANTAPRSHHEWAHASFLEANDKGEVDFLFSEVRGNLKKSSYRNRSGKKIGELSAITEELLQKVLAGAGISDYSLSPKRIIGVATNTLFDMSQTIHSHERDASLTEYAAHWCYWIYTLKPISIAFAAPSQQSDSEKDDDKARREIPNINSSVALEIALAFISRGLSDGDDAKPQDASRYQCPKKPEKCDGKQCVLSYAKSFFAHGDRYFEKFIKYRMENRTMSAEDFQFFLDQLLFASCRNARETNVHT
jgi:hypothetical protein